MPETTKLGLAYPTEGTVEWYALFQGLMDDIDSYVYGLVRTLLPMFEKTDFTWTSGSSTLSWSDDAIVWLNTVTGEELVLDGTSIVATNGKIVYVRITEGSAIINVTPIAGAVVPVEAGIFVIGVNDNGTFRFNPKAIGSELA